MRIIAGQWRGRRISAPAGREVRPTGDRVREAWMSILQHRLPGAHVLDLFAGSGALGLEALSRGAVHADFVENGAASVRTIRENIATLDAGDRATVHRTDALRFIETLEPETHDVAFADPPYRLGLAVAVAERWLEKPFAGVIGIEHEARLAMPEGGDSRRYGDTVITFYGG